ncbi:branched-chain amino acid ABC transporter substrate-binding protein [Methylobacterium currus]|uniref:Branched-chain amino acid ABC transporter substrate-binding protein n=1 Tax=Methylobacterium currus TaxID=2051553 RepID=A0A2R4WMH6_9HYPH|nr:ABC transporter substrate-binding protein [Methylobacterium currus]AWB22752.1 branched-chain amino acid ABC transporter substrate-binding protein [Methylobacterium currus]UHC17655.1 ABC transporter substrate-binding protein [Methylobacterium currus]
MISRRALLAGGAGSALALSVNPRIVVGQTNEPIKIGVVTPLSGPQEFIGSFVKSGAEVAAEMINKAGGVKGRPLQLEFRDEKANPAAATTVARELLGLGYNLQLGTISSTVALAYGPLMQQENGINLTCGAGTEKLNHENYTSNVFRVGDGTYRMRAQARFMAEKYPEVTSWTGIIPDHEYGRTVWAVFVDGLLEFYPALTGKTPTIVPPVLVPYGSGDYRNFITQMMKSPAKGVVNATYGGDAATFFQQARPYGLFRDRILMDAANEFIVANALKDQVPKHWTGSHWYYANNKSQLSQDFYQAYVAKTGNRMPMGWAGEAQAAVSAYAAAIAKAGSTDTKAVIAALKGLTWDTVTGPRTIRAEDNQAIKNLEVIQIEPAPGTDIGFKVSDSVQIPGAPVIEPATPGQKMALRTAS